MAVGIVALFIEFLIREAFKRHYPELKDYNNIEKYLKAVDSWESIISWMNVIMIATAVLTLIYLISNLSKKNNKKTEQVVCLTCGALVDKRSNFCPVCANAIRKQLRPSAEMYYDDSFCIRCGSVLNDGAKFCKRCGEPVNNTNTADPEERQ